MTFQVPIPLILSALLPMSYPVENLVSLSPYTQYRAFVDTISILEGCDSHEP